MASPASSGPPPTPIPAPVSLEEQNTLETYGIISSHIWQEFHWKAPGDKYMGPTAEDRQVAERLADDQTCVAKHALNAAFCEWAITTVDVDVPEGQEIYLHWWLEDKDGGRVVEHPDFSKAHFDSKHAKAKVAKGRHAWRWDGRLPNDHGRRTFLQNAACWSRISAKSASGHAIPIGNLDRARIDVQGHPYRIFVVASPKLDADLIAERQVRGGGRWLNAAGNRFQADCWMRIYRGVQTPGNDAHIVFLGHGAVEATDVETSAESTAPRWGAIATPHDVELKGYFRTATHGGVTFWLFEMIDEIPVVPAHATEITLAQVTGGDGLLPAPINPFSGVNRACKTGVHGHQSFPNTPTGFIVEAASVGCTTFVNLANGTPAAPAAEATDVLNLRASFGSWHGNAPTATGNKVWGPPLAGGRPGTFRNKQNKRNLIDDALLADGFDSPLLRSPKSDADPDDGLESPHMQSTVQQAVMGGFLEHEIPTKAAVPAEPDGAEPTVDSKVRLRVRLVQAAEDSLYWLYHRAVAFGHVMTGAAGSYSGELWIPRMAQRLWNGHWRNLQLQGQCEYRWYYEERFADGGTLVAGWIGTKPAVADGWANLDGVGRFRKSNVPTPRVSARAMTSGCEVYSVFRYRVRLQPQPVPASGVWGPLPAQDDLFTEPRIRARFLGETIETVANVKYLVGQSELFLYRPLIGDFGRNSGSTNRDPMAVT